MKSVNYQQNMNKLTLVKFRTFVCQKTPLREWKGKPENGRRYLFYTCLTKGLYI